MIRSTREWRALIGRWSGIESLPPPPWAGRAAVGELYPWAHVLEYARAPRHRRVVSEARDAIDFARDVGIDWRIGLSCGKDSTALALLCAEEGWRPRGVSVKDDLDYPGEVAYLDALSRHTGIAVDVLTPPSLRAFLAGEGASLLDDLHGRTADLAAEHFYGLLDRHRAAAGYDGLLLGLRAEESRGRRLNRATHGDVYRRRDGLTVAQPLANWSALDVHAFLATHDVPLLPVYLCLDEGDDPFGIRKSWWLCGGGPAAHGHYGWLRRWWPEQWAAACQIDPAIGART